MAHAVALAGSRTVTVVYVCVFVCICVGVTWGARVDSAALAGYRTATVCLCV